MNWLNSILKDRFYILFAFLFLATIVHYHNAGDKVAGDGYSYFMYCRNIFFYGDIQLNAADKNIQDERFIQEIGSGVIRNPFSIGPAIFWLPFYGLAHGFVSIGSLWTHHHADGFEHIYREYVGLGTIVYTFIGFWLLYRLMRRRNIERFYAGTAVVVGYLGTFIVNYVVFEPSMAHGLSFFLISLFLYVYESYRESPSLGLSMALGVILGAAGLVRYTNLIFGVIPVLHFLTRFNRKAFIDLVLVSVSAAAVFFIQMWVWKISYGSLFTIPQGQNFMQWTDPKILETLFAKGHGVLSSHLIIPLGLVGYLIAVRKNKVDVFSLLIIFGALVFINAAAYDWYAGHSFGNRRFECLIPFVILGLPASMSWFEEKFLQKKAMLVFLLAALVIYNLFYLDYYRQNISYRDKVISPTQVMEHIHQHTGSLVNFPINVYLAARYGLPLGKAERLLGNYPENGYIFPATDAEYVLNGWERAIDKKPGQMARRFHNPVARMAFAWLRKNDLEIKIAFKISDINLSAPLKVYFNQTCVFAGKIESDQVISFPVSSDRLVQPLNVLVFKGELKNLWVAWVHIENHPAK